jgi:hypothetical protein
MYTAKLKYTSGYTWVNFGKLEYTRVNTSKRGYGKRGFHEAPVYDEVLPDLQIYCKSCKISCKKYIALFIELYGLTATCPS